MDIEHVEHAVIAASKIHGLCTTEKELRRLAELACDAYVIVEIGSYCGRSTTALAWATGGDVFAIDTWRGSDEDPDGEKTKAIPPAELYKTFIVNMWDMIFDNVVTPLRCDSVEGAEIIKALGYKPDLIFLDAGHDYKWVRRDIITWLPFLQSGGVMIGHDLPHPGMVDVLNELLPGWTPSVDMLWEYKKK